MGKIRLETWKAEDKRLVGVNLNEWAKYDKAYKSVDQIENQRKLKTSERE